MVLVNAADVAVPTTKNPTNIEELKALTKRVQDLTKKVMPSVVGIVINGASGSGVIISEDGYVLTAGHVSGDPGKTGIIIFPDGQTAKVVALGCNRAIDSGLMKIVDENRKEVSKKSSPQEEEKRLTEEFGEPKNKKKEEPKKEEAKKEEAKKEEPKKEEPKKVEKPAKKWAFVEMADSKKLEKGQWCFALGHHDGYQTGRTPPLRVGRIQTANDSVISTDCTLVGGDSGGPLFDLDGKVIGIHSRIGPTLASNFHVPVNTYKDTWERLISSESWGGLGFGRPLPVSLGAKIDLKDGKLMILEINPQGPIDKAGLKKDDQLLKLDGKDLKTMDDIYNVLRKHRPGDEIEVVAKRGDMTLNVKVVLIKP